MAININQIIKYVSREFDAGGAPFDFNWMILTENPLIPMPTRILEFADADAVGDYFGISSQEYTYAALYFDGIDNAAKVFQTPKKIYIARATIFASNGVIFGRLNNETTLAEFQAITAGAITFTIGGVDYSLAGVDLSSTTSLSEVAATVETLLNAAIGAAATTITYDSAREGFRLDYATIIGATSTVGYCDADSTSTTSLAYLLGFSEFGGAILSQGQDSESITEALEATEEQNPAWWSFSSITASADSESQQLECAAWAHNKEYKKFFWYTPEVTTLESTATSGTAYAIATAEYVNTVGHYAPTLAGGVQTVTIPTSAAAGSNLEEGAISYNALTKTGITPQVTSNTYASVLIAKRVNFFGEFANWSETYNWYQQGVMFGADTRTIGQAQIYDYIQVFTTRVLALYMENTAKEPDSSVGQAQILRLLSQTFISQFVANQLINTGVSLSSNQKEEIITATGSDNSIAALYKNGFYLKGEPITESDLSTGNLKISAWIVVVKSVLTIEFNTNYIG